MKPRTGALGLLLFLLFLAGPAPAAPGDLDPTFDGDGRMTFQPGGLVGGAIDCVIDSQGRIIVAGTVETTGTNTRMAVVRILANGGLDPSFGVGGVAVPTFPFSTQDVARSVALDSTGRIIVAGTTQAPGHPAVGVAFLLSNGTPDLSMGDGGTTIFSGPCLDTDGRGVLVQANGRIVLAGTAESNPKVGTLLRRMAGGAVDHSFGQGDGFWGDSFEGTDNSIRCVALDASGRLLTGGLRNNLDQWQVRRFNSDGTEDFLFGIAGARIFANGSSYNGILGPQKIAVLPGGSILTVGSGGTAPFFQINAARLTSAGALDTGFDGDGKAQWTLAGRGAIAQGLAAYPDGRYLVAGHADGVDVIVARFLANGTIDPAFGVSGAVVARIFGTTNEEGTGIRLDSAGRIVVCGNTNGSWGVARLQGDTPAVNVPDPSSQERLSLAFAGANPFLGEAHVAFQLPAAADVDLEVHDVSGARVRTIASGMRPAGPHQERWDGRDDAGRAVTAGVYFLRLRAAGDVVTTKAIKID